MKKKLALILTCIMAAASICACGKSSETAATTAATEAASETATEAGTELSGPQDAIYNVYNKTGEKVTSLTLTDNESGKEVFSIDSLDNDDSVEIQLTEDASVVESLSYTLAFTTESGYTGAFETLHFEQAPITLLASDAMTGATPITFAIPE